MAADENGEAAERPIEEIRVGDKVYSTDPTTGESGFKEVVQLYVKETDVLVHIDVGGEEITTTPDHPFRVGNIWICAKDLREGDLLTLADGSEAAIEKIQTETLTEPVTVYNFEVADFHTYYVGNAQILVHNDCSAGGAKKPDIGSGGNQADGFDDWLNKGDADNVVYYGIKEGKAVYTGITKQDLARRLYQHNYGPKGKGLDFLESRMSGLTRNQARALEQHFIELKDGPNAMNKIFSISTENKYYNDAKNWAIEYIKTH